ncbi:hypothetical protein FA13DRAFT_1308264 [Coprinellus micaceus]|uniref:Uncharacterized protein n=1 Tax=Coprinellus micaceus TaxID=71717 RepID=A0A4Y7SS37_COPMI|nr:hypothetical protein FA13DRAFT_1308264 [Coprinellus micaceus]
MTGGYFSPMTRFITLMTSTSRYTSRPRPVGFAIPQVLGWPFNRPIAFHPWPHRLLNTRSAATQRK